MIKPTCATALGMLCTCVAMGQDGFPRRWLEIADQARAEQPRWITPLVTVTPRLEQEFRTDFVVQRLSDGSTFANLGNSKGLEVIPTDHLQVTIGVPPYVVREEQRGFGDVSFLIKYRLLSANTDHGDYIVTAFLGATVPTGSFGAPAANLTPTIAGGKGWGRFDVQSTASVGLPLTKAGLIGHPVALNAAFQYRLWTKLWPEVETNSTFWRGGPLKGRTYSFVTVGVIAGRFRLKSRVLAAIGAGLQTAVTHDHPYSHAVVVTVRFPF